MRMLKKIFLTVLLAFLFVPKVYAAEEFASSYDVTYDIDTAGLTTVTEKVFLRNLTEQYYADQFKLVIGATQVSDIKASDGGGSLEVNSTQKETFTEMNVKFNQQVVGLNKVLPWTLQFKTKDFTQNIGKVWEVTAPKVSSTSSIDSYKLTISVPLEFGEPTAVSPTPKNQTISYQKRILTFDLSQLRESGVSASFGIHQLFDFDLIYHLENDNLVPILTNISLPPDTAYQDVIYQNLEPNPLNVTVDNDGNYLAWYKLKKGEKLDIKLNGSAKLYTQSKVKNPILLESLRKKYTQSDKYWEKDHPQIQSKLKEIIGNATNSKEKVRLIYRYVVNLLKYDSNRIKGSIERLGAVTALNNPDSAVCMEFTDLFIALLRAANIPARELDGYAYTVNPKLRPLSLNRDLLHAWPEYWDENKGWVMVDPTWENTSGGVDYFNKLDLNHFVFSIKGFSSESPIPAGSYKYNGQDSQDVKVNLAEKDFLGKPELDVSIENSNPILAGFPGKIKIKIANTGNAVYPSNDLAVKTSQLSVLGSDNQKIGLIPPFGEVSFDYNIRTKTLFDKYDDQIMILIGSQKFTKDISIKPFVIFKPYPLITIGLIGLMGLIYLSILGVRLYVAKFRRPKQASS